MHTALIQALLRPDAYPHPVTAPRVIETHISWVILTGPYAYKIKKPVDLGFLDFSTLELRRRDCEDELRLNRRYAPDLYLDVVAIAGSPAAPRVGGDGAAIEFALRMRQFDPDHTLDALLRRGTVERGELEQFAQRLAQWHAEAPRADAATDFGSPAAVTRPVLENFAQIRAHAPDLAATDGFARVESWAGARGAQLAAVFAQRKADGFVRECHGDLHCGNLVRLHGALVPFDCLEFSANLRWIDVISELAFLLMDLDARSRADFGRCVLNTWLEHSGDYDGVPLLRYYQCYRAMVRAKVAAIRARAETGDARTAARDECARYIELARGYTVAPPRALIVMHGISGSGKSVLAQRIAEQWGGIRVRSDAERKRLAGLAPQQRGSAETYSREMTAAVYARLNQIGQVLINAGYCALLDATYLRRAERDAAHQIARQAQVGFAIVDCRAPPATLRERVARRYAGAYDASDADLAVLDAQLKFEEPLDASELAFAIHADPDTPVAEVVAQLRQRVDPCASANPAEPHKNLL